MPSQLPLPDRLAKDGWKVKIRDRERLEPPHATVIRGNRAWRWNLRSRQFMDREPDPSDVPAELIQVLADRHALLATEWDAMYPGNRVAPPEEPDDRPGLSPGSSAGGGTRTG